MADSGTFDHFLGGEYPPVGPSSADLGTFDYWVGGELPAYYQASGVTSDVFEDLGLVWDVSAFISDDLELVWDVSAALTDVSDDLELVWDVGGLIFEDLELLWYVYGGSLYKTSPISGTVNKDTGRSLTVSMIKDE